MCTPIKTTTGLAGLAVAQNPKHTLEALYGKILRALRKIPPSAAYRQYTEEIISRRADLMKDCTNSGSIEDKINGGQVEELIVQAENELSLARKMFKWRAWEPLITQPEPDQC